MAIRTRWWVDALRAAVIVDSCSRRPSRSSELFFGLASFAWLVRNWRLDRVDVRLTAGVVTKDPTALQAIMYPLVTNSTRDTLRLTLANHGRRDVQVREIGGTYAEGAEFVFEDADGLPCTLREGQSESFALDLAIFKEEPSTSLQTLWARDALGRTWPLHNTEFLRVQGTARRAFVTFNEKMGKLRQEHARKALAEKAEREAFEARERK